MIAAIADTHSIIWYLDNDPRLSPIAASVIEETAQKGDAIGIASITFVEMVYLSKKGRISSEALQKLYNAFSSPFGFFSIPPTEITFMTKNEILTALNQPEQFILAVVLVDGEQTTLQYLSQPFSHEPDFATTSVTFDLKRLFGR